jgi:hypothetical protein
MHTEQMDLIREEMAHLRALNEEEQRLRAEIARQPAAVAAAATRPTLRIVSGRAGASASGPPARGKGEPGGTPTVAPSVRRPQAQAQPPPRVPPAEPAKSGGDSHVDILRKIEAIQNERQGRWETLLKSLVGKAAGRSPS